MQPRKLAKTTPFASSALQDVTSKKLIKKTIWSKDEDNLLKSLIEKYGSDGKWTKISVEMKSRSGKQCRERYHNHLAPDIRKGFWTHEEDAKILSLKTVWGNQWAKIAKELNGRSDNAVKNRYHLITRRSEPRFTSNMNISHEPLPFGTVITRRSAPHITSNMNISHEPLPFGTDLLFSLPEIANDFPYSHSEDEHMEVSGSDASTVETSSSVSSANDSDQDESWLDTFIDTYDNLTDNDSDDENYFDEPMVENSNEDLFVFQEAAKSIAADFEVNKGKIRSKRSFSQV